VGIQRAVLYTHTKESNDAIQQQANNERMYQTFLHLSLDSGLDDGQLDGIKDSLQEYLVGIYPKLSKDHFSWYKPQRTGPQMSRIFINKTRDQTGSISDASGSEEKLIVIIPADSVSSKGGYGRDDVLVQLQ
jgi:hypothetical protein